MKIKITNKGVYAPDKDGKEQRVPVGTVIDLGNMTTLPQNVVNKCVIIDAIAEPDEEEDAPAKEEDAPAKTAVTNPKK
jgi:hypothetical protein